MQLEQLIGKVKTEKYGARIIDVIQQYRDTETANGTAAAAESNEKINKRPAEGSENKDSKRRRKNKALVLIESSEEEKND